MNTEGRIPVVSVVIPTYNRAHTIGRSVRSVLSQEGDGTEFEVREVIVVDDGSSDDTEEVLKTISDQRLHYHRMPQNGGASRARNAGADMVTTDWIAFHDSDDEWLPEKLRTQFRLAKEHPEYDMIYSGYVRRYQGEIIAALKPSASGDIYHDLVPRNWVGAPTILIRRETWLEKGGFDPNFPALEDWDFALRVAEDHLVGCISEPTMIANLQEEGISWRWGDRLDGHCRLIAKNKQTLLERGYFNEAVNSLLTQAQEKGVLKQVGALLEGYLKS